LFAGIGVRLASPKPKEGTMKQLVLALTALSLLGGVATPSIAKGCRDKHGKFIKCPAKPKMCRDAKGHFMKCK
jgi:hypothetical protein